MTVWRGKIKFWTPSSSIYVGSVMFLSAVHWLAVVSNDAKRNHLVCNSEYKNAFLTDLCTYAMFFLDLYYQSVNSLSWEFDLILFFINLKVFLLYTIYLELTSTERSLNISMSANTPLYICWLFSLWRGMADY